MSSLPANRSPEQIRSSIEETRKELARIKHMKRWKLEQQLRGRRRMLQFKK